MNALFKKACFSKQQHYFYIRKVSFKILKKKNALIPAVTLNMSLSVILSSLIISLTSFGSDLTILTRTVKVSSEIVFFSIATNKSFCWRSYSSHASLFIFIADFLDSPIQ